MKFRSILCPLFLLSALLVGCSPTDTSSPEETVPYIYQDQLGRSYTVPETRDAVVEVSVPTLLDAWRENVAAAEEQYVSSSAALLTEGYIQSICKVPQKADYYIVLAAQPDAPPLSPNSLRIYFRSEAAIDSLLCVKAGDYVTLLAKATGTTPLYGHPALDAVRILMPDAA